MERLRRWDTGKRLGLVDITRAGVDPAALGVDMAALNRELHGTTRDGAVLVGIDAILAAYTLVGRGWLVWPLRVRPLRPVLVRGYHWLARNRHRVSRVLGYRSASPCDGAACGVGHLL
jgi:predicted DCC family thiol-disulfide oxidoreductase YuxK